MSATTISKPKVKKATEDKAKASNAAKEVVFYATEAEARKGGHQINSKRVKLYRVEHGGKTLYAWGRASFFVSHAFATRCLGLSIHSAEARSAVMTPEKAAGFLASLTPEERLELLKKHGLV